MIYYLQQKAAALEKNIYSLGMVRKNIKSYFFINWHILKLQAGVWSGFEENLQKKDTWKGCI